MNNSILVYQPPKAKIYWFNDRDRILTDSGINDTYAENSANALNELFGDDVTTTTIEIN